MTKTDSAEGPERRHSFRIRVYWEDTDASGIVYHASYLRFAERARTEWLRSLGGHQNKMLQQAGIAFAVRSCCIDFAGAARLDDLLEVETRLVEMARASMTMRQTVYRIDAANSGAENSSGSLGCPRLVTLSVKLVCINSRGRAVRLPGMVRSLGPGGNGNTEGAKAMGTGN